MFTRLYRFTALILPILWPAAMLLATFWHEHGSECGHDRSVEQASFDQPWISPCGHDHSGHAHHKHHRHHDDCAAPAEDTPLPGPIPTHDDCASCQLLSTLHCSVTIVSPPAPLLTVESVRPAAPRPVWNPAVESLNLRGPPAA